jgi:hypothetical protein
MDRRRIAKWAAGVALGGAIGTNAHAGAVTFTGNVATDFPSLGNGLGSVPGQDPSAVAQASWITQSGWVNGWVMKGMELNYNQATDSMQVGVNFYSIAGDPSGSPTGTDPRVAAAGGSAPPNLGGRDSISVEFAAPSPTGDQPGTPVIVAGVPESKSPSYTGLDGFTVAAAGGSSSIQTNYGTQMNSAMGNLAFDPSPAHPDFEFTIKNWSQFAALNGSKGFWVSAYAGSPDDAVAGESHIAWTHIPLTPGQQVLNPPPPPPTPPPTVPEPTTVAGWSLMIAGAAWALRRKRKAADQG